MFNMEQWKENWLAQGMERGRKEGWIEGRNEEKRHGAARMLALGKLSIEEIAEGFGLGLDEVRAIAAKQAKG